ncbi:hypothetical protein HWV00_21000 (plasmid) [Moritella sp. 24]|uniref:hypothetical protein n=1 Tax=Moritella sp. 24 TaxID=2746230 RepID=UPI001BAB2625|nr:hypothetical protein [Moritella sp. 24]QUM78753.1 hypothetical protein HWV00_21000 [Moritella sp. 24]
MKKISPAQQVALDKLIAIGKPATSQEIGVQVSTMFSLQRADHVIAAEREEGETGRDCEVIKWSVTPGSRYDASKSKPGCDIGN